MTRLQRIKAFLVLPFLCLMVVLGVALGGKILMRREPPPRGPLDPRYDGPFLRPKLLSNDRVAQQIPNEPTRKQFMDAFLGKAKSALPGGDAELNGNIFTLVAGGAPAVIQNFSLTGRGKLRVQVADQATVDLLSTGLGIPWQIEAITQEGMNGAAFVNPINQTNVALPSPRVLIPVHGKSVAVSGTSAKAEIFNRNAPGTPDVKIMAAIIPEPVQDDTAYQQGSSNFSVSVFELSHHFTVDPSGGVIVGDVVRVFKYNGVLTAQYPARSGGVYPLGREDAFVQYVPIGPAVSALYTFFRTI